MENSQIIEKAKNELPDYDILGDMYDLTLIDVSSKFYQTLGYSKIEILKLNIISLISVTPSSARKLIVGMLAKNQGTITIPAKSKTGEEILLDNRIQTFQI